jgi:hypothetical protein
MADDRPFGTLPVVDVAPLLSTQAAGLGKVSKVFPQLRQEVLADEAP